MTKIPTVQIVGEKKPITINKSDFVAGAHKLHGAVLLPIKTGDKYIICGADGAPVTGLDGIDEGGYSTVASAKKAIEAL